MWQVKGSSHLCTFITLCLFLASQSHCVLEKCCFSGLVCVCVLESNVPDVILQERGDQPLMASSKKENCYNIDVVTFKYLWDYSSQG